MLAFIIAVIITSFTGHGHITTYQYDNGQSGIIVQVDAAHCIGYDTTPGEVGVYGNIMGAIGGDCA